MSDYFLKLSGEFEMPLSVGLFDFDWTYAIFNPRKTYKTRDSVFSERLSTTPQYSFDVEFHEESNDV